MARLSPVLVVAESWFTCQPHRRWRVDHPHARLMMLACQLTMIKKSKGEKLARRLACVVNTAHRSAQFLIFRRWESRGGGLLDAWAQLLLGPLYTQASSPPMVSGPVEPSLATHRLCKGTRILSHASSSDACFPPFPLRRAGAWITGGGGECTG